MDPSSDTQAVVAGALKATTGVNQLDFEVGFFAAVLKNMPDHPDALRSQAEILSRKRRFGEALVLDRRLCDLRPTDPVVRYNLACSLCQVGRRRQAMRQLQVAVTLGYNDWLHLESDRDLAPLRYQTDFRRLIQQMRARR
jgi:predicted Zn-dependent protease